MSKTATVVNFVLRVLLRIGCKIEDAELPKVPPLGPLILVANHINFVEVPLLYSHLYPRPITGWAKVESWKNPLLGWLFRLYNAIPIRRGELDLNAANLAVEALKKRMILAVSPEGTRSYTGHLQQAKPGVVLLALKSKSPIMPMAYWGGELFWKRITRLRRTPFHIRVGNPFTVDAHGEAMSRDVRQEIADQIMYQIAALLPPDYRGVYGDMAHARQTFLNFEAGIASNLLRTRETDLLPRAA